MAATVLILGFDLKQKLTLINSNAPTMRTVRHNFGGNEEQIKVIQNG